MKRIRILVLFVVLASFAIPTLAFDNEPDGFRGISWGASASSIEGLEKSNDAATFLNSTSRQIGVKVNDFPLTSYRRKGDKLEFNGVEMQNIVYYFYKDQFYFAKMFYSDSTYSPAGEAYGSGNIIGVRPPHNYDAKMNVDQSLKKYFGDPTDSPNVFFKIALKVSKIIYLGKKTEILSNCDESAQYCNLNFISVDFDALYNNEMKAMTSSRQQLAREEAQLNEARKEAKPDF